VAIANKIKKNLKKIKIKKNLKKIKIKKSLKMINSALYCLSFLGFDLTN
jgi:hypothetical protein